MSLEKNLRANSLVYETRILGCRYTITCRTRGNTASGRKGLLIWASKSLRGDDLRNYDEMPVRDLSTEEDDSSFMREGMCVRNF